MLGNVQTVKIRDILYVIFHLPKPFKVLSNVNLYTVKLCHYLFFSSARHQGYPKLGKPSMVTSSSLGLEGKEPTSAYRLQDWGPKPRWSARCETRIKFAAILCSCAVQFVLQCVCVLVWILARMCACFLLVRVVFWHICRYLIQSK